MGGYFDISRARGAAENICVTALKLPCSDHFGTILHGQDDIIPSWFLPAKRAGVSGPFLHLDLAASALRRRAAGRACRRDIGLQRL